MALNSSHVSAAVDLLLASRSELVTELNAVDKALVALGIEVPGAAVKKIVRTQRSTRTTSVKARVLAMLQDDRGPWNAARVVESADRRGEPLQAKEPSAATRTAFLELVQEGLARRAGYGFYESTIWPEQPDAAVLDLHQPAVHVGDGAEEEVGVGH